MSNSVIQTVLANSPGYIQDVEELFQLFGNKQPVSPVPALFSAANATAQDVENHLLVLDLEAEALLEAAKAQLPADQATTPTATWQAILAAASNLINVNQAQRAIAAYRLALNNWQANNPGSLTPPPVPTLPDILKQYE